MTTYLDWNEALGSHFFNAQKMGETVYLHADRATIETVGAEQFGLAPDAAWQSFIRRVREGFSPKQNFILLNKIHEAQRQTTIWTETRQTPCIKGKKPIYPPYLAYLVLTVLPITEGGDAETFTRRDAYNPHLNAFLKNNKLGNCPSQNEHNNWNDLWQALADWSFGEQNGQLGIFKNPEYKNQHWKYAGKPLTQCLVPPKTLQRARQLFDKWQLTPTEQLSRSEWREQLAQSNGALPADLKKILAESDNELGNAALDQIVAEHQRWTGAVEAADNGKRAGQIVRIHTFLKLLDGRKDVNFQYRVHTDLDYPEDLMFGNQACYDCIGGWSNPLNVDNFSLDSLILRDEGNQWEARMRPKNRRYFLNAERYGIGDGRWAEVDEADLYVGATALVLVKIPMNTSNNTAKNGQNEPTETRLLSASANEIGCEKQIFIDYQGIPADWRLMRLEKLTAAFIGLRKCAAPDLTSDILRGGLKLRDRQFLDIILPEVVLKNAVGTEAVYLKKNNGDLMPLEQKQGFGNIWLLPDNAPRDEGFKIGVNAAESWVFELKNHQKTPLNTALMSLPKRDNFGNINPLATISTVVGINAEQRADRLMRTYGNYFFSATKPVFEPLQEKITLPMAQNEDWLLYFLSQKQELTTKQFFEAFENILAATTLLAERNNEKANLTWLKRRSLSLYEALGFVDISTSQDKIRILPPQLIPIPAASGFTCLSVGGRTPMLQKRLFTEGVRLGVSVELDKQDYDNQEFLLPQRLVVKVKDIRNVLKIKELATACGLRFDYESVYPNVRFPQMDLLATADTLENLLENLPLRKGLDPNYCLACQIFNPQTCRLETVVDFNFDKTFQLAVYKSNEYKFQSVLWRNGEAFGIDKNWGRMAMLKRYKKSILYFDAANISPKMGLTQSKDCAILAVPTSVTLPRYFMQSLALCSGFAPTIRRQNIEGMDTTWYFFDNIPKLLIEEEFKKLGQKLIETRLNTHLET